MGISEVREYDCWLQGRGQNQFSDALKNCLSRIVVKEDCLVVKQAALELQRGLKRMFGVDAAITDTIQKPCTVVGTATAVSELTGKTVSCDRAEGFCIEIGDELSAVAGADCNGTLYGAFRLLMELAKGAGTGFSLEDAPRSGIRMINHWDNLDGTIERGYAGPSLFYKDDKIDYDPQRIEDYARLLASIGINCLSINNVNVRKTAKLLITEQFLPDVAKLADIFRPFGIRLMLSINFGAPYSFGDLDTADPLDPRVGEWWAKRADLVYKYIPDLAGFLVKADSEGEAGPFQYGRDHADGANMLAKALKPHNGTVIWRCFVYNCTQDWRDQTQDRACAAYDHFHRHRGVETDASLGAAGDELFAALGILRDDLQTVIQLVVFHADQHGDVARPQETAGGRQLRDLITFLHQVVHNGGSIIRIQYSENHFHN